MFEKWFSVGDGRLLIPLSVIFAGMVLVKAIFGLQRSRSADRKDFLELWAQSAEKDGIWLEVAIRHLFGAYLPATVIRTLLASPQAGQAFCDVSIAWSLLDMDDKTKDVRWKAPRHMSPRWRRFEVRALNFMYVLLGTSSIVAGLWAYKGGVGTLGAFNAWTFSFLSLGTAIACLVRADAIASADKSVPRWLGLT